MANSDPFDLSAFKASIKSTPFKLKQGEKTDNSEALFTIALALSAAVKKVFYEKSETKFSSEPILEKKLITQFMGCMRVDGREKFNETTFFSTVHFYKNTAAMEHKDPAGLLIVFIDRKFVPEMLRLLKYPYIDYDEDEEVLDGMGAIANLIGGYFKRELIRLGYADLEMSPFRSYTLKCRPLEVISIPRLTVLSIARNKSTSMKSVLMSMKRGTW
jgi:hypothetical protein